MLAKDRDNVDRRDFMTGSIAAVGASAIIVSGAGAANAQQNTETRTRTSGTEYTGDICTVTKKELSAVGSQAEASESRPT